MNNGKVWFTPRTARSAEYIFATDQAHARNCEKTFRNLPELTIKGKTLSFEETVSLARTLMLQTPYKRPVSRDEAPVSDQAYELTEEEYAYLMRRIARVFGRKVWVEIAPPLTMKKEAAAPEDSESKRVSLEALEFYRQTKVGRRSSFHS